MATLHPTFITNENGEKLSVVIPIQEYYQLLEDLEEFEDIKLYDEAIAANEPSVSMEEAFEWIESKRKEEK